MHYLCQTISISLQGTKHLKPSQIKAILLPASLSWSENIADWFLLNLVLKNLDSVVVDQLLREIFRSQNESGGEEEETEEREVWLSKDPQHVQRAF